HPVKQGLVQVLSVFIDTVLICSATAFMCMSSGVEPSADIAGAQYVQSSISSTLGAFGPVFITVAMILFSFTTLLGNLFYVDKSFSHILGKTPGKIFMSVYYVVASAVILLGAVLDAGFLWNLADVTMGVMTLINMPVIIYLSKYVVRALKDYDRQRKNGEEPVFKARNIDLPDKTDYWN
ncbi:MAG: alanine:cation symporter family protein, partial [Clostridia bacterium]|nr:alanine:cation symporter family protein [Clostridia bacterium]